MLLAFLLLPPAAGFELPQPDHGVEEEFDKLWSGHSYDPPSEGAGPTEYITRSSDHFYDEPPGAPDSWNGGEVSEFRGTGATVSLYPSGVNLENGNTVKDAYVKFFDVSGSTRVLFSPQREVLYVPTNGEVRGFVDYRVEGNNIQNHSVEVELVQTGERATGVGGFSIPYEGLSSRGGSPGTSQGTQADVSGTVELKLRAEFTTTRVSGKDLVTDTLIVNDTLEVKPYSTTRPPPISIQGRYPDNDSSLFFLREAPWSSVSLPDGTTVHSNWRFFSARDTDWDRMRFSSARRDGDADQRYIPLRVYAYPTRGGIHVDGDADIRNVLGEKHESPTLPDGTSFDLPETNYTAVQGFDVRYEDDVELGDVELNGVVRGTSTERPSFPSVQRIRATNLTLSVAGRGQDSVEVKVNLTDGEGRPIETRANEGFVRVEGDEEVETGVDGTAVVEVQTPPSGTVTAEYVPEKWYEAQTPYTSDSATLDAGEGFRLIAELGMLSQVGVFLLPFLLLVYFTDRMLGLGIWPPWRRI